MNETELIRAEYREAVEAHGFMHDRKYREMLGLQPGCSLLVDGTKAMRRKLDELVAENQQLRSRLEPERQKIWVLVWRLESGRVISESHTDPDEFYAREMEIRSKGLKHGSILTSLPI